MYKRIKTKIEHTTFDARTNSNGDIISYRISPDEGYRLHEITLDEIVLDDFGNETGEVKTGFTTSYITAGVSYDFEKNERQIYVVEIM